MRAMRYIFVLSILLLPLSLHAQLIVDCSGQNQSAYPSINAALANAGPGSTILVSGSCNESVSLVGMSNISLGAWFGQTAAVNGSIFIGHSVGIYLYGLNVTNPSGDGITLASANDIAVDTCNSSGNGGAGLDVIDDSHVVVTSTGTFDNNGFAGIRGEGGSVVLLGAWAGLIDISNNAGPGIFLSASMISTFGQTAILNNGSNGAFGGGWRGLPGRQSWSIRRVSRTQHDSGERRGRRFAWGAL